jgi:glycosyltransferase involved in cell wall biosynthesis
MAEPGATGVGAVLPSYRRRPNGSCQDMRLIVASPNGIDPVLSVARAASRQGNLERAFTSFQTPPWATSLLRPFGSRNRGSAWLQRRVVVGVRPGEMQAVGTAYEVLRATAAYVPGAQRLASRLLYRGKGAFDQAVADRLATASFDAVVGHYASSQLTMTEANRLGRMSVLIFENSHPTYHNNHLAELAGLGPDHHEMISRGVQARVEAELQLADLILVPSAFVRNQLVSVGVMPEKVAVEPYGVDPLLFKPGSPPSRTRDRPLRCLCVGQVSHRKGVSAVLRAARRLGDDVEVTLLGPIVSPEVLRGRTGNVHIMRTRGQRDIAAAMKVADVLVVASLDDAYPLVTLEAMAAGLPVVVSSNSGTSEFIHDGRDGLLIPPGDSDALCGALCRLANAQMRSRLGSAARRKIEEHASWDDYGNRVIGRILKWMVRG